MLVSQILDNFNIDENLYAVTWKMIAKWTQHCISSLVCGKHWSMGVWLKAYVITKSIM